MSSTPPLTYEQMMEMFRETREGLKELRKRSEEVLYLFTGYVFRAEGAKIAERLRESFFGSI